MKNEFINQLKSSVKIRIQGKNIERFLKKVIRLNIEILDLKIVRYNEAILKIYKKDLEKVEEIKTIYEIEQIDTFGLDKLKKLIKKNQYLFISIIIGYIILQLLTHMIFKIEIVHNNKEIRNLLRNELKEYGIEEKHLKKSYSSIQSIKKKILNKYKDQIEWLEIEEEGTKYIVRVEERIITKSKNSIPIQNIVAKKSAILKKIIASSGEIVKNVNDYVNKGDVVITGDIQLNEVTKNLIGANGKIYGEVWYKTTVEYPLHYQETISLNKNKTVYAIKFLNRYFSIEWNRYKTKNIKEKILLKNNLLPIQLVKQEQTETKVIDEKYTKEEAIKKAIDRAKAQIEGKLNDNEYIIDYKQLNVEQNDSKIVVEIFFSVCEDITDTKEIVSEETQIKEGE